MYVQKKNKGMVITCTTIIKENQKNLKKKSCQQAHNFFFYLKQSFIHKNIRN